MGQGGALSATFGVASIAFATLAVFILVLRRLNLHGSGLVMASLLQTVWCAHASVAALNGELVLPFAAAVELLRGFGWMLVLCRGLSLSGQGRSGTRFVRTVYVATAIQASLVLFASMELGWEGRPTVLTSVWFWNGLLMSILGLILVEQFARNVREDARWQLKPLWLGIGMLFAADLATWSAALLLGSLNPSLVATKGAVNALVALVLGTGAMRMPAWGNQLFKSKGSLGFNTALLVAGAYVLTMSAVSYLMRAGYRPANFLVEGFFAAASLVFLVIAAFSDQFRAWLRVTAAKALGSSQYDYRSEWLRITRTLSGPNDVSLYERIPIAIARLVNSGKASLWLRDRDGILTFAGGSRDLVREMTALPKEFLDFLQDKEWIYDLHNRDSSGHPLAQPSVPDALANSEQLWLVVPLICNDSLVGIIIVGRPMTKTKLGWEQLDLLRTSSRQVASYLGFEMAAIRLAELHQFEALNKLSGFVMHDLRHLVAQLALVVDNASRHRRNPQFIDDAILTIEASVKRMTALMGTLGGGSAELERRIELVGLCKEAIRGVSCRTPIPSFQATETSIMILATHDRLLEALEHLLRNAQEATSHDADVVLRLEVKGSRATIEISDAGSGMDAEFVRTQLFKPFVSTKGEQGMGLGAYEARETIRKLGGAVSVESEPGRGSKFTISLPLAPNANQVMPVRS